MSRLPSPVRRASLARRWSATPTSGPTIGLWTAIEVADAWGLPSVEEIHDLAESGALPHVMIDGAPYFDPELIRRLTRAAILCGFEVTRPRERRVLAALAAQFTGGAP